MHDQGKKRKRKREHRALVLYLCIFIVLLFHVGKQGRFQFLLHGFISLFEYTIGEVGLALFSFHSPNLVCMCMIESFTAIGTARGKHSVCKTKCKFEIFFFFFCSTVFSPSRFSRRHHRTCCSLGLRNVLVRLCAPSTIATFIKQPFRQGEMGVMAIFGPAS